jgi:Ca-activated chloride channel homolog
MNAHSLEHRLRHTNPPAPEPGARLDARRAALAEFERIHATGHRPARDRSGWLARVGGLAAACVAVISASLYLLAPQNDRVVQTPGPVVMDLPEPATETPVSPATPATPASIAAEGDARKDGAPAARVTAPEIPVAMPPVIPLPTPEIPEVLTEEALDSTSNTFPAPATSSAITTVPAPAPPPPRPSASFSHEQLEEIIVTGSRIKPERRVGQGPRGGLVSNTPLVTRELSVPVEESRDRFAHFETNPVKRVADEPVSTFSVDVDTAAYSFVRRQLNAGTLPDADAVRVEEMINYFDYAWPLPESREQPFRPTITVSDSPWGAGRKLVHIGIRGYELPRRQQPDVNLVLLVDVSGSMNSPDKLPLAQRSLAMLLDTLQPSDTVGIVVYAGAAGQVLAPTPVSEKEKILAALDSLRAGGSTAGAEGIRLAYQLAQQNFRKDGVNRILLATDGDFNVGISDTGQLKRFVEREREKGVYLSVLGFGQGNYRDEMAQALAQNGNGVAAYIDTLSEARKVLVEQSTSAMFTIAKDVKLQVEFNPSTVAEYRLVGYETRALQREDFNNDKVDAGDVGAGHAVTAIYEITPVGSGARSVDELRYGATGGATGRAGSAGGKSNEYGFLKIRYKLPKESRSRLLEQPILADAGVPQSLRQEVGFSTAVAGFAQLLRGGRYTGELGYADVMQLAESSLGEDPHGYRNEFLQLVRRAQVLRGK